MKRRALARLRARIVAAAGRLESPHRQRVYLRWLLSPMIRRLMPRSRLERGEMVEVDLRTAREIFLAAPQ